MIGKCYNKCLFVAAAKSENWKKMKLYSNNKLYIFIYLPPSPSLFSEFEGQSCFKPTSY